MVICQFIVAIIGVTDGDNDAAVRAMIAFICIYIFFFATTWGPGAWVVIGEIFPLPIRSRGVGLSTASNWYVPTPISSPTCSNSRNKVVELYYSGHYAIYGWYR
jgi:hypothetical protein